MSEQEKNFRTQYYDKVGFRLVEEKKSIESLLKEQPMKHDKLVQFSLRFGIPAMYRLYVWKILLGILPAHQACHDHVWFHREQQGKELARTASLLCPQSIDSPQELRVLVMSLIENGTLPLQTKSFQGIGSEHQRFLSIVQTMSGLVTSDTELFWMASRFYQRIKNLGSFHQFPDQAMQCLRSADKDGRLYKHLSSLEVSTALPLLEWFMQGFAGILPETSVERIWDRVICGCSQILVYVAVAIFLVLRRPLLAMNTVKEIDNYLTQIPEDCGDRIVTEALNLWLEHGTSTTDTGG